MLFGLSGLRLRHFQTGSLLWIRCSNFIMRTGYGWTWWPQKLVCTGAWPRSQARPALSLLFRNTSWLLLGHGWCVSYRNCSLQIVVARTPARSGWRFLAGGPAWVTSGTIPYVCVILLISMLIEQLVWVVGYAARRSEELYHGGRNSNFSGPSLPQGMQWKRDFTAVFCTKLECLDARA